MWWGSAPGAVPREAPDAPGLGPGSVFLELHPEIVGELAEGLTDTMDRCTGQERLARDTIQCRSEVRAGPQPGPQADSGGTRTQTQTWGLKPFKGPLLS